MDSDRRMPSWLKATIRAALIATAVGGGLFVLSQVLAPSEAHAETVSASTQTGPSDSLLGPALKGVGSTLGSVTETADGLVGTAGKTVHAVTQPTTKTVSKVVSSTVKTLPAPVQAPVKQVTTPLAKTVTQVTAPVTKTTSQLAAAKPVSALLGTVSGTVDGVVDSVEQAPVVGGVVGGLVGQTPVSSVVAPSASGLDDTVSTLTSTIDTTVTQTTTDVSTGVSGDAPGSAPLPIVSGLLPGSDDPGVGSIVTPVATLPSASTATVGHVASVDVAPATAPAGPQLTTAEASASRFASPAEIAAVAAPPSVSGSVPFGAPGTPGGPQAPASALGSAGSGSAAGSRSGGNGTSPLAGALGFFDFPAEGAGLSSLVDADALPASPVFEHDSSPD